MPHAVGVVVQQQDFRDGALARLIIQQHEGIGAPCQPISHRTSAAPVDKVPARLRLKKAGTDHVKPRFVGALIRKKFFRVPQSRGTQSTEKFTVYRRISAIMRQSIAKKHMISRFDDIRHSLYCQFSLL